KTQLDSLRREGINTYLFDPMRFPWLNHMLHRDHRKIVVVDGKYCYTGGMNVADYYAHGTKRTGIWRDMHMRLQGPVVQAYEDIFEQIWTKVTAEELDAARYKAPQQMEGDKIITVVNREPKALSKRIVDAYVASIDAARSEIRIVNPYPTGVRAVRRALYRALKRGIRLRFMVSYSNDNRITPDVTALHMKKLMERGAEVWYYMNGFHHSKIMMVDGEFCTVGTANLDGRSLLFDYEVNAFIFDDETTRELNAIFDEDLKDSWQLTKDNYKKKFNLSHRMSGRIFSSVKGML
ncbi:MAG: cardiolipin synthase, partial [Bacteroidaceae bacterium]|nr:cardiolipin synthase [Bacteroidaceae bacterium]